ncbi:hypothetical protein OEZ86_000676 [Tetradesmus obliquus]|nr:hypothetical protein OEZ85_010739 [Tetradesmus obliquus]WIA30595.1 hypothetical protein OEZ86_000676 [Tetradesmus obliquus]
MLVRNFSYEIMVLDEYAGAMLLQVAQDPVTTLVMSQLLMKASGKGLHMWPPAVLGLQPGSSVSFSTISKAARRRSSTALGYRRASGSMLLAPLTDEVFVLDEGDRLVVIADSQDQLQRQ